MFKGSVCQHQRRKHAQVWLLNAIGCLVEQMVAEDGRSGLCITSFPSIQFQGFLIRESTFEEITKPRVPKGGVHPVSGCSKNPKSSTFVIHLGPAEPAAHSGFTGVEPCEARAFPNNSGHLLLQGFLLAPPLFEAEKAALAASIWPLQLNLSFLSPFRIPRLSG